MATTKTGTYTYRLLRSYAAQQAIGLALVLHAKFEGGDQALLVVGRREFPRGLVDDFQRAAMAASHQVLFQELEKLRDAKREQVSAAMDRLSSMFRGTIEFDSESRSEQITAPGEGEAAVMSGVITRAFELFQQEISKEAPSEPPPVARPASQPRRHRASPPMLIETFPVACSA